ncbi:DUF4330 domain-containing protein [Heliophilum fasciatum]|uniref:Uncharacterized protein DUF4330 n=1 Tax=Heliophilum fasciatum TaxID=35700 RepID=A0A4R2RMC1_9FIRM|nr:DUF4330 domain-containing protein [Heliophilum fasciatum]MCW2278837.1 phosphodiesterase/alkaline phosphatase D-like protein [Heliophilum fasciatum]TCP64078.1 uncharacterized protein DUF4330 [Heliophilum fasciatum]
MKLVDDRGRWFGLINPLDLVVLVAIVALVFGLATKTKNIVSTTTTEVQFEGFFKKVHPELVAGLNTNEKLVAGGVFVEDARVESIRVVPSRTSQTNAQGETVVSDDPHYKDVYVVIRGTSKSATADLKVGNQEIKAGKEYWYKTQTMNLQGIVDSVKILPSP